MSAFRAQGSEDDNGYSTKGDDPHNPKPPRKICIIGAGLSGLGFLRAILDLPPTARKDWVIDCFDARDSAGGIWLPQPSPPSPPFNPATPAYDNLETVTACAGITFPNRPFPPSTLLFTRIDTVHQYIQDFVRDCDLARHIRFRHKITRVDLRPGATESTRYPYTITIEHTLPDSTVRTWDAEYSTVIVCNGITPLPRHPNLPGGASWLEGASANGTREMIHSMWYRSPEILKGKMVVIVGYHASGKHIAQTACDFADEVHQCFTPDLVTKINPPIRHRGNYHPHPRAASYTPEGIVCVDGSLIPTPPDRHVLVINCTGYRRAHPFLPDTLLTRVEGSNFDWDDPALASNDRLLRPLYHCMIPVDPKIPYGSLAFGCIFPLIWSLPTSYAQGIWLAHLMADLDRTGGQSAMVPSRPQAMTQARKVEEECKEQHVPIDQKGYVLMPLGEATDDLSDQLIREVRQHSHYSLPAYLQEDPKREFTEPWRRRAMQLAFGFLKAWTAARDFGGEEFQASFTEGAVTEEDYAESMEKLNAWHHEHKDEEGNLREEFRKGHETREG